MHPASPSSPPFHDSPRILIVRLSAHGDVMHTLPLLSAIKKHHPQAVVGWLVESSAASLLENHPLIDRLHVSHRKRWLKMLLNPLQWFTLRQEVGGFVQSVRNEGYHISFDVQGLLKSAIWPVWAKIPRRYGFKATRESADVFYTDKLPPMVIRDGKTPAVERYLDFARVVGIPVEAPEFVVSPVSDAAIQKVDGLLGDENSDLPLVVLAPFTRWPSKHWEPDYWAKLLAQLQQLQVRVAILGAPADLSATQAMLAPLGELARAGRVLNLVGKTDWPDLFALFLRTRLLIGLDSAPLHIADAVGIPEIIGLYGPTAPGRTGPIGRQHTTLTTALACQPCFERVCPIKTHACMKQLTPEVVLGIVRRTLGCLEPDGAITP